MRKKIKNRGFSLVEILIAFGILAIVSTLIMTFISTSSNLYRRQSKSINLQNELQEASNKISDALMEATEIRLDYGSNKICIYTGADENYNNPDSKIKPKLIVWDKGNGHLYIFDDNNPNSTEEAYCMTKNCTKLDVSVVGLDTTSDTFANPLVFKVDITLAMDEAERNDSKTTTIRNKIQALKIREIGGAGYKTYTPQ